MRTRLQAVVLVGLLIASAQVSQNSGAIASAAQDRRVAQESSQEVASGISFDVRANAKLILGPYYWRKILVYTAPQSFTLDNVHEIFRRLSEEYSSEDVLLIDAVSDRKQLRQLARWFATIKSFPFGDVFPVSCGTNMEPNPPLSAQYRRGFAREDIAFYSASGESTAIELKRVYYGCDELEAGKPDLVDAMILNCKETVRSLLDSGVDPNAKSRHGGVPIFEAAYWKWEGEDILTLLLDRGADINQRSSSGWTALIAATMRSNSESLIKLLLSRGADVNVRNDEGRTALMYAAGRQDVSIVRELLARGADVNITDGYGETALSWAKEGHDDQIIRALREAGALD